MRYLVEKIMIDKNILIVDDDDNMREAMKETVLRLGVSVDTAENGRIGFEKATKKVYDLDRKSVV